MALIMPEPFRARACRREFDLPLAEGQHSAHCDLLVIKDLHVDLAHGVSIEVFSLVRFRIRYRFYVPSVFAFFYAILRYLLNSFNVFLKILFSEETTFFILI